MPSPNAIILIFDTLRADHLSCYGGQVDTPHFDRLAEHGTLFESAFAAGPATPISHAALYTGQYPSENGVTGQYLQLPENVPVMAEWLQKRGYDTYGITGPAKMGSDWGYDRGFNSMFETYYDLGKRPSKKYFKKVVSDRLVARDFIQTMIKGGRSYTSLKFNVLCEKIRNDLTHPFFALCNVLPTHLPYDPPRPYKKQRCSNYSRPRWFFLEYLLNTSGDINNSEIRLDRIRRIEDGEGIGQFLANPDWLNNSEIELLQRWYEASVKYADDIFGRFLEFYERELIEDTILIVTADHGEQLGEKDIWEHSHYLFDETIQVPLLIAGPRVPTGVRRGDLASLIDIFDTVCDLCDLETPNTTSGESLFSDDQREKVFMEYGERDQQEFAQNSNHGRYLDTEQLREFSAGRKGVRTDEYKFVMSSIDEEKLYRIPGEELIEDPEDDMLDKFRKDIKTILGDEFGRWPEGDPSEFELSNEVEKNLRDLGYI